MTKELEEIASCMCTSPSRAHSPFFFFFYISNAAYNFPAMLSLLPCTFSGRGSSSSFKAVSCIRLSVCFSRVGRVRRAAALHLASAKCNLSEPAGGRRARRRRAEVEGGLNDYNAPGMWAIHPG